RRSFNDRERSMMGIRAMRVLLLLAASTGEALGQLTITPTGLTFAYQVGGPLPPTQTLQMSSTSGNPQQFTDSVESGVPWLAVTPSFASANPGTTPATLRVTVSPAGLR